MTDIKKNYQDTEKFDICPTASASSQIVIVVLPITNRLVQISDKSCHQQHNSEWSYIIFIKHILLG